MIFTTGVMVAWGIAIALGLLCVAVCKFALSIPSAAGAGAPGSILLLISFLCGVASIFCFGLATGFALT